MSTCFPLASIEGVPKAAAVRTTPFPPPLSLSLPLSHVSLKARAVLLAAAFCEISAELAPKTPAATSARVAGVSENFAEIDVPPAFAAADGAAVLANAGVSSPKS